MPTQTRTFPITLNSTSTAVVTEIVHFRDVPLLTGESAAVYLEAMFLNVSLKSFQLMKFPNYEGDESDAERLSLFTAAELASQKIGLRILSRKNNTGAWREKAEIILTNAGRKSYFDLLIPYLAKAQVRLLEYNDALGIQLIDYGNGLLKLTDYIEIECAVSVDIAKKNNDFTELSARIASLELALDGRLTNVPGESILGRNTGIGTVEVLTKTALLQNSCQLSVRSGSVPFNANTWLNSSFASVRWIDGSSGHLNLPTTTGVLLQFDSLFGSNIAGKYRIQTFNSGSRYWDRAEIDSIWSAWKERAYIA